jgi:hypothetical protein
MLAIAPAAHATTFGANLNRPADNGYTCSDFGYGSMTCSAESSNIYTGENGFPPGGSGIVTEGRVKVGPVTGPMQVVVEQAFRQDNPGDPGHPAYACCQAIDASPVFTPKANAVSAIDVHLPVQQDLTPNAQGVYVDQHLSLSVLAPNVPIPASLDNDASVGVWFPAWQVGDERAGSYGTAGADILFEADWQPAGAGFVGGGPALARASKAAHVEDGEALVKLACNLNKTCDGKLTLSNAQANPAAGEYGPETAPPFASTKQPKTYAKGKFEIKSGETETVAAKLTAAGEHLLERHPKAKVWGNVKLHGSSALAATFEVTLKR